MIGSVDFFEPCPRSSARKRPPPVKVRVGGRKTRSMSREDFNVDMILNPVSLKREKSPVASAPELIEPEPEVRKTRKGRSGKTEESHALPKPKTARGRPKKIAAPEEDKPVDQPEIAETEPTGVKAVEPEVPADVTPEAEQTKKTGRRKKASEPVVDDVEPVVTESEPVKPRKTGKKKKAVETEVEGVPEKPVEPQPEDTIGTEVAENKPVSRRGRKKPESELEVVETKTETEGSKKKAVKRTKKKTDSQSDSEKEETAGPKKARKTTKKGLI